MTHPFPTRRSSDLSYLPEAEKMLKSAVARDKENHFAWYQLGVVYERMGDTARAALATAERYQMMGNDRLALASGKVALAGVKAVPPDWLRAQEIAMVGRTAAQAKRKRDRRSVVGGKSVYEL